MQYRREIDGLRALAVIPVIFFHAGIAAFSGGFIGVDVFFVISGYLITSIILSEKEAGAFSVVSFYERRARRILPAQFLVMAACIPFAWFWLLPEYTKAFSNSLIAASTFVSNFFFWNEAGYFDTTANLKPLLHTWSLAVEEQYYLLFPIFLTLVWRFGRRWLIAMLVVVAVLSLVLTQFWSRSRPDTAFYLLPTRGWELLIGAFVAFYLKSQKSVHHTQDVDNLGSFLGVLLIAYALFMFDSQIPFPSVYTLIPTVGTALIIVCASPQTMVGKWLGNRLLVGIGLISYSAYLWHQPLFSFARHIDYEPSQLLMMTLVFATLILAYLTWQYVEKPFRNKAKFSRRQIFSYSAAGITFFVIIGLLGHVTNGFEQRITLKQRQFLSYFDNSSPNLHYINEQHFYEKYRFECDFYEVKYSKHNALNAVSNSFVDIPTDCYRRSDDHRKAVFLWGDSHAQELYYGLKQTMPADWKILLITTSGCEAKLHAKRIKSDMCEYSDWLAYKSILVAKPEVVIIGQNIHHDIKNMTEILSNLKEIGIKRVIFTGPTPHWETDLPKIVADKLWKNTPRRTFLGIDQNILNNNEYLKNNFPASDSAEFISITDYFCNHAGCLVYLGDDIKKGITAWDYGHLTPIASYAFAKDVLVKAITKGF